MYHSTKSEIDPFLGASNNSTLKSKGRYVSTTRAVFVLVFAAALLFTWLLRGSRTEKSLGPFYSSVRETSLCSGISGGGVSHAGFIGLNGDSEDHPKRSFLWYFEATANHKEAPVILTIGGGPGTSGLVRPLFGQSPCLAAPNATVIPNPDSWTEHFNLLALDHPIGVGYSYGTMVNNSRSAAHDVYDFLQKLYTLFPHLVKNKLVLAGGSHGGIYVPHIATVIHEQNGLIAHGLGLPGALHINLESLMISNPLTDIVSYFRWLLQYRCHVTDVYNSSTCAELYKTLPLCLEGLEYTFNNDTIENRVSAYETCSAVEEGDVHGIDMFDIRRKCGDMQSCYPEFQWIQELFDNSTVREQLGIPDHVKYIVSNLKVNTDFDGDQVQRGHLMYEPLLNDGIRLLHYIGAQDANSPWPGTLSFLKLIRSPFQQDFINAPDIPWPSEGIATVRAVGKGAGNLTSVLIAGAGHFVDMNQPALVKLIVDRWIDNRAFD